MSTAEELLPNQRARASRNSGTYSPLGLGGIATGAAVGALGGLGGLVGLPKWAIGLPAQGVGIVGKALNLPNVITSPLASLVKGITSTDMQFGARPENQLMDGVGNSLIKSGLTALIPGAGLPLSILSMLGFNPMQGIRDWSKSDSSERNSAGYNGGFWGDGSWKANNGEANLPGNYSGSGYGNTSGPGSGAGYTPSPTNGGANLPGNYSGSGYGNTYGPGSGAGNATGDSDY